MENLRFILLAIAAVFGVLLYQSWQHDHPGKNAQSSRTQSRQASSESVNKAQSSTANASAPKASRNKSSRQTSSVPGEGSQSESGQRNIKSSQLIHVVTDNYRITINPRGGDIYRATLRNVPVSSNKPNTPLTLLKPGAHKFFRQTSRIFGPNTSRKTHRKYKAKKSTFQLKKNQDSLKVPLTWTGPNGRKITKVFVFKRNSYRINLKTVVKNAGNSSWKVWNLVDYWRHGGSKSAHAWFIPSTFSGVGWYAQNSGNKGYSYHKRKTSALDKKPVDITQTGGWVAINEHYFLAAAIPGHKTKARFFAKKQTTQAAPNAFKTGFVTAPETISPGHSTEFKTRLFVGPKLQNELTNAAPGLDLTVDYGFMTVLARPIFKLLSFLHSIVGNWGVAIILLTLIIKLLFYKLSEKQYRSMARMRKFQPRMQQIKEQYGDDRQQMQAKMMELYKKEGFNPLAGCWPMLVQAPVFIVLYWVLLESAEMRTAPFLWINDLSSPDPFFILPVYFGITMFIQQRLTTSTAMDPLQQRLMQIMPIGLAVFFTFFPAGLVLYWCTNNTLSIAQQWYIYRKLDTEGLGHKATKS